MSGDWIKMRSNLWDDPRITAICDATGQSEAAIVGACYWLWATADQHSENGRLPGISLSSIDRKTGIKGFAAGMVKVGWLAEVENCIMLLRFEDHNGASAKKRAVTAKRVSSHRSNDNVTPINESCNARSVTTALAREREEKEVNTTPIPPLGAEKPIEKKSRSAFSLKTYLSECKEQGIKPIPEDDSVFDYAEKAGISHDVLALHWSEFRARYSLPDAKKYKAWRTVFGKSVRGNWFRLWYFDQSGACLLTTAGQQAKNLAESLRKAA